VKVPCPSREKGHTWGVKEGYLPARFEGGSAALLLGCLGAWAPWPVVRDLAG
jgi:hypothetical protein